jgi:hypothetical protein
MKTNRLRIILGVGKPIELVAAELNRSAPGLTHCEYKRGLKPKAKGEMTLI